MQDYIIQLLQTHGKLTTSEIRESAERAGHSCPDEPVRYLNKLRKKGLISGKVSLEQKGWVWWKKE